MQIKIISILGGAVILLWVTLALLIKRLDTVKTQRDQAIEFSNSRQDSLEYFKNAWGRETARSAVLDLTLRNAQRLQSDERLAWVRQFESVNKRMNNLESATRTVARTVGTFSIPTQPVDTTGFDKWWNDSTFWQTEDLALTRTFDNRDEWIRLQGTITDDTVVVRANALVPIENVVVFERKKILGLRIGRKQWFSETASPNPYVTITESTVIRVGKRKKR